MARAGPRLPAAAPFILPELEWLRALPEYERAPDYYDQITALEAQEQVGLEGARSMRAQEQDVADAWAAARAAGIPEDVLLTGGVLRSLGIPATGSRAANIPYDMFAQGLPGIMESVAQQPHVTDKPKPGLLDGILGMIAPFIPVLGPIVMAAHSVDRLRSGGSFLPIITNLLSAIAPAFGGIGLPLGIGGQLPGAAVGALGPQLAGQIGTGIGVASGLAGAAESGSPLGALQALAPLGFQALGGTGFFGPGAEGGGGTAGLGGGGDFTGAPVEGAFNLAGTGPGVFQGQFGLGGTGLMPPQIQAPAFGSSAPQFGGGFGGLPTFTLGGAPSTGPAFTGSLGGFGTQGAPQGGMLASQLGARGVGPLSTQTIGAPEQPGIDWMSVLENLAGLAGMLGGGQQQGDQEFIINRPAEGGGAGAAFGEQPFLSEEQISMPRSPMEPFTPAGLQAGAFDTEFQPPSGVQGGPLGPFGIFPQDPSRQIPQLPGLSFPGPFGTRLVRR